MSATKWQNPTGSTTVDSFETNLQQIEQTNKLLANIENKLNNFFHKSTNIPQSQPQDSKDQIYQNPNRFPMANREEHLHDIGNTMLSPIQNNLNRESLQDFLSGEGGSQLRVSGNYIKIVDPSKANDSNLNQTDLDSSYQYNKSRDHHQALPQDIINRAAENQDFTITDHHSSMESEGFRKKLGSGRKVQNERNGRKIERYANVHQRDEEEERIGGIDKRFYEKKIEILEERLDNSEKEISNLLKIKGNLNNEIVRLKVQVSESSTRYIEDLTKSLKAQEERLRKEFEQQHKYRSVDRREDEEAYLERIESLLRDKEDLKQQVSEYKREIERLKEQKSVPPPNTNLMSTSYETLEFHLDTQTQRNDKLLKSPSEKAERAATEGRASLGRSQQENQLKSLVDSLNLYKQELESLRKNNMMIQDQFEKEVQSLRNELESEKMHNQKLAEKIHIQSQALEKYQGTSTKRERMIEASPEKETQQQITTEYRDQEPHHRHGLSSHDGSHRRYISMKDTYREGVEERSKSQTRKTSTTVADTGRRSHRKTSKESERYRYTIEEKPTKRERSSRDDRPREGKREGIPFTHPEIKSGLLGQEKKSSKAREALYRELAELQNTPPRTKSKSRSRSHSHSKKKRKPSEDQLFKGKHLQKSPETAYEEFEEELKRLKGVINHKMATNKKSKSKIPDKENAVVAKKERKSARESKELKADKSEKRLSATSSKPLSKRSTVSQVNLLATNPRPLASMNTKSKKKLI